MVEGVGDGGHALAPDAGIEHPRYLVQFIRLLCELAFFETVSEGCGEAHRATGIFGVIDSFGLLSHADIRPLAYLFGLELGDALYHRHDEPSGGVGGVQVLGGRNELFPPAVQQVHHVHEVPGVAVDTVHLQDDNRVPFGDLLEHLAVSGAVPVLLS